VRDIRCPPQLDKLKASGGGVCWNLQHVFAVATMACLHYEEDEDEEFITSGNWRGKHNSLSGGAGADQL
jgi:hypothetical protein